MTLVGCTCVSQIFGECNSAEFDVKIALTGKIHLKPDEAKVRSIRVRGDDADILFDDHDAFNLSFDEENFCSATPASHGTLGGSSNLGPSSIRYSGKRLITGADTKIGKVAVIHMPYLKAGPKGGVLKDRIYVEALFEEPLNIHEAMQRAKLIFQYLGVLAGRPQNALQASVTVKNEDGQDSFLAVTRPLWLQRSSRSECSKPCSFDVLIDAIRESDLFNRVMAGWLNRESEWREARWRFFYVFQKQLFYDLDRLIGAANMFDVLPATAAPHQNELSHELLKAKGKARDLFVKLPGSLERDSILNALGRLGTSTLKQKLRHVSIKLLTIAANTFPDFNLVTDQAVNCRNHYVHGSRGSFDYGQHFAMVIFFTDTLEFLFAASDLIESGWDAGAWSIAPTSGSHPFARYRLAYGNNLERLRRLLEQAPDRALVSAVP